VASSREPRFRRREPPPTYRYAVRVFKDKLVVKSTSIRAKNDDEAELTAQRLMDWERGDAVTVERTGTA
jgi:hypothetical protein